LNIVILTSNPEGKKAKMSTLKPRYTEIKELPLFQRHARYINVIRIKI
jgi:hypothetical protein